MECFLPYQLVVELWRGKIHQVRTQINDWQGIGILPKQHHLDLLRQATSHLANAVTNQHDPTLAAQHAELAICSVLDLADLLAVRYVNKIIAARRRTVLSLPTAMGINLGSRLLCSEAARQVLATFNAVLVPLVCATSKRRRAPTARTFTIARSSGASITASRSLPARSCSSTTADCRTGWRSGRAISTIFCRSSAIMSKPRCSGSAAKWTPGCAARVNVGHVLGLADEDRLRLAVRLRDHPPPRPGHARDHVLRSAVGRVHGPRRGRSFAAALCRRAGAPGLELSGIGLELNVGDCAVRFVLADRLECSRLIDRWAMLGVPLWIFLTVPSGMKRPTTRRLAAVCPAAVQARMVGEPEAQRHWLRQIVPLLLAKPVVHGVIYNQLTDSFPHEYDTAACSTRPALPNRG